MHVTMKRIVLAQSGFCPRSFPKIALFLIIVNPSFVFALLVFYVSQSCHFFFQSCILLP